jgi:hypothetical protein
VAWCSSTVAGLLRTTYYIVNMSENVSVRLEDGLAQRLRLRARAAGETLSDRLRRYAEEGVRRDEHPLITFRDGPTGRRAGVLGGPDVWEIAMWVDDLGAEVDPLEGLVEESVLTRPQVEAALRYRAAYPDEIEARIELHRRETSAAARS